VQLYYDVDELNEKIMVLSTEIFGTLYDFNNNLPEDKLPQHIDKTNLKLQEVINLTNQLITHIRGQIKSFTL